MYSYDKYGKIKSVENTDTKDVLLKCTYDTEKRLVSKQTESGAVTKYTYDSFDRYLSVTTIDIDGTILSKKMCQKCTSPNGQTDDVPKRTNVPFIDIGEYCKITEAKSRKYTDKEAVVAFLEEVYDSIEKFIINNNKKGVRL